ncbi:MAG: hypothetical protein JNJ46_34285 [Myxococcales bacterium]|nr:hypothetical protein [Myxococcales bacterium]
MPEQIATVARITELRAQGVAPPQMANTLQSKNRPTANGCLGTLNGLHQSHLVFLPFEQSGWAIDSLDGKGGQAQLKQRQWHCPAAGMHPSKNAEQHVTEPAP